MDLSCLSGLISALYSAAGDYQTWQRILPTLATAFRAESGIVFAWNTQNNEPVMQVATANISDAAITKYKEHYRSQDLWLERGLTFPHFTPVIGEELVPRAELLRSEFYNDYLKDLRQADVIGSILHIHHNVDAFIAFHRSLSEPCFTDQDKVLMSLLMPHVMRALQLHYRLVSVESGARLSESVLDRLLCGVIVVAADRTVLFTNQTAEALLRPENGITITRGRLSCSDTTTNNNLKAVLYAVQSTDPLSQSISSLAIAIARPYQRPLHLKAAPIVADCEVLLSPQAVAVLFLDDPDGVQASVPETFQRLYDLTSAEARLTSGLVLGESLKEYADRTGLSVHTVRTQLKSVFSKVGVNRQSELIRVLRAEVDRR